MSWRWISLAASLAALIAIFGSMVDRNSAADDNGATPPPPGYYLKDAVINQTQADGSPELRITATRIDQQRKDGAIHLATVHVDYLKVPDRHWILTADQGEVPEDSRIVQFSGNVELRPSDTQPQAFLRTEALAVDTDKQLAYTTRSPVQVRLGSNAMTVRRLQADLKTEQVKLESVRGQVGSP
jgi:LPS export ABC transporter protein LptC